MESPYSEMQIRAAFVRMVANCRANPGSVMTHAEADALPSAERAERDANHLLAYLQGDVTGIAPDGEPAVEPVLAGCGPLKRNGPAPDLEVQVSRYPDGLFSAFAVVPGAPAGHGLGNGDLEGVIEFVRERCAA